MRHGLGAHDALTLVLQSMVMQKKLRKVISYVARIQDIPMKGPYPKNLGTVDAALLKWFRGIPGVGCEVSWLLPCVF